MNKLKIILKTGVINTIRFNYNYFGFKGLVKLPVFVSRDVKLSVLKGEVKCSITKRGGIQLGYSDLGIVDEKYQRGIWENSGVVVFDGIVKLGKAVRISNSGILEFGDKVIFTGNSQIVCKKNIVFGDECLISWENLIMDTDFHSICSLETPHVIINPDKNIFIGKRVWIGCRCLILKGTNIPDGTVIAAGSKISGTLNEKNCIYGDKGVIISKNVKW